MAVHPQSGLIYAVSETEEFESKPAGGVTVLSRDAAGNFHVLYRQSACGANPVYISIDHTGGFALVANYKAGNVAMLPIAANGHLTGSLKRRQSVSTLAELFSERNLCGDFHFARDEKYLYVSNRGHDSIVCFRVDPGTGELSYRSHISSHGHEPRIFALDPSVRFIVAAHQKSRNAVVYQIDLETGDLSHTGYEAELDMPVHVLFL